MAQNNPSERKFRNRFQQVFGKIPGVLARWFFMIALFLASIFCVFVWYGYIFRADWSETRKQQYISEQASFSFNKTGYEKTVEMMKARRDKFENYPSFAGRDIFFPD